MRVTWLGPLLLAGLVAAKEPDVAAHPEVWPRLRRPRPGQWLDLYPEKGQTFAEYRSAASVRPTRTRHRIYVLPMLTRPPADPQTPDRVRALLEVFLGRPARLMPPVPLPRKAYDRRRRQVSVTPLARELYPHLPADAFLMLVLTDRDLYSPGLHHLFGWAADRLRIAIVSTYRTDRGGDPLVRRRRILALAAHEAGHVLAMPHCTFYACLMNGAAHQR
ncbi:MAG: archaemetzincin, partial [Planctomycetota bacterium]